MKYATRGALVGVLLLAGLVAMFYTTTHKGIVLWVIWKVTPLNGLVPVFPVQRGIAPTTLAVRLYELRLVLCGGVQGLLIGTLFDLLRSFWRRNHPSH